MKPIVRSWFFGNIHPDKHALAYTQVQHAWIRMLMAVLCLGYLSLYGTFFAIYATAFEATAGLYLLYNLYIIYSIRRHPASPIRLLVSPVLDVYVVSFGLVIDGGNISGLSLIYLAIILGNAFRYGNMMMLYTQALSLAGLVSAAILSLQRLQTDTVWSLLIFQIAALMLIPLYAMALANRYGSRQSPARTGQASFGLLDRGLLPIFTYRLDEQGSPRITHASAALQAISREPISRLIGEQVDMLAMLEDGDVIVDQCRKALQQTTNAAFRFYIRGRNASDQILNLMGEATRIRWQSQWVGLCFLLDMTENARDVSFRNSFIPGVIHDLRNVLTSIIGQTEVLQMDLEDPALQHRLEPIIEAGEYGADIISRLPTPASIATTETPAQGTDIRAPLEKLIDLVQPQLPEKVTLACHVDDGLPAPAMPISELEQIMLNLIQNAYQSIPEAGTIDIRITADANSPAAMNDRPGIVIQVKDTGRGIASENLDKIFTTFWTTRKEQGGTGLGLSLVKRIVQQQRGHIDVQSTPGQGSTFTIHLPADASAQPGAENDADQDLTGVVDTQPWRILLVDDSPVVLQVHQAMLTRMGHHVVAVPDAQTALSHFEHPDAAPFELILTDYNMPGMDGLQLIQQLRHDGVRLPIMVITAYGEEERLQQLSGLDAGVIHKPVSYRALSAHIATIQANQKRQAAS